MKTNNRNLVSIPPPIRSGPGDMMTYLNMIRKSLIELRDQMPPSGIPKANIAKTPHPWKLFVEEQSSEIRLFTWHGAITVLQWSGSDVLPSFNDMNPIIGMAQTFGDPFGGTVGHLVLDVSKTYGVWIRLGRSSGTHTSTDTEFDDVLSQGFAGSAVIIADDTKIDPDDDWDYSGTNSYIFIGQVSVDANGAATIKQHLKSDLVIPLASTLPSGIIHP